MFLGITPHFTAKGTNEIRAKRENNTLNYNLINNNVTDTFTRSSSNVSFGANFIKKKKRPNKTISRGGDISAYLHLPPTKYPVKDFKQTVASIIPLYAKDTDRALRAAAAFEDNKITGDMFRGEVVNSIVDFRQGNDVIEKIEHYIPNFIKKGSEKETDQLYRFVNKEELDRLFEDGIIETELDYNGLCFRMTTDPNANTEDFARIKFKYFKNRDYKGYDLTPQIHAFFKESYSFDDIEQIDRLLPNGYVTIYKKEDK